MALLGQSSQVVAAAGGAQVVGRNLPRLPSTDPAGPGGELQKRHSAHQAWAHLAPPLEGFSTPLFPFRKLICFLLGETEVSNSRGEVSPEGSFHALPTWRFPAPSPSAHMLENRHPENPPCFQRWGKKVFTPFIPCSRSFAEHGLSVGVGNLVIRVRISVGLLANQSRALGVPGAVLALVRSSFLRGTSWTHIQTRHPAFCGSRPHSPRHRRSPVRHNAVPAMISRSRFHAPGPAEPANVVVPPSSTILKAPLSFL
eukprot:6823698-Pyramimonas_sp.AAC.1